MDDRAGAFLTLGDLALEVRSKNAGPFWMTLEAFMPDDESYRIADALITTDLITELYQIAPESLQVFRIPQLRVVKVSFPRPVVQGSLHDRDMHAGQHHVPLANALVPPHEMALCPGSGDHGLLDADTPAERHRERCSALSADLPTEPPRRLP
jgi:hypothetical protein